MKTELITNIKWYLATEKPVPNNVHKVIAFMTSDYITTLSVYQGHFNCSNAKSLLLDYEFMPGKDVLYWAYHPNLRTKASIKCDKQHCKNE